MAPSYTLQPAHAKQAEEVGRVIRDTIARVNGRDYPAAEIERLLRGFSTAHVEAFVQDRETLVALSGGIIIGTGALQGHEIKSVFVAPDWHRRGVGTALMGALEGRAAGRGEARLRLSSSLSATAFYRRLGNVETSRAVFGAEETVVMEKAIAGPRVP